MMPTQDAERWRQKKELFQRAVGFSPAEREAFLASAADAGLAREVAAMLAAHDGADEFLEAPPVARLAADPTIGRTIDRKYRVEERLGRGGMGSVYRATHLWTGRAVAVKIIAPEFMRLPEFVERFKREARAAGRLRHPNVVNVTDFGFSEAGESRTAYLVMEYLDGMTLAEWLEREGRLPVDAAVEVVEQTAAAVDAAHAEGILHRDLKPANIWIEPNGRGGFNVKVLDFGLAKLRDPLASPAPDGLPRQVRAAANATRPMLGEPTPSLESGPIDVAVEAAPDDEAPTLTFEVSATPTHVDPRTIAAGLTRAGVVMGTPAYMSPEQCAGAMLDARSDVYSLGVVAYELLAGRPPFVGKSKELVVKHMNVAPPPLRRETREVPRAVEEVVLATLAKSPADRPPTAGAFAAALRTASQGDAGLLGEATDLWRADEDALGRVFVAAHLPFAVAVALLVEAATAPWPTDSTAASLGRAACWAAALLATLLSVEMGTAAFALVAERLRAGSRRPVPVRETVARLARRSHKVFMAGLRGLLQPTGVCAAPAAVVESLSCREALVRSRSLSVLLRAVSGPLVARQLLRSIVVVAASAASAIALGRTIVEGALGLEAGPWSFAVTPLVAIVTVVASAFALRRVELARALFYVTARRANGAPPEEADSREIVAAPRRARRSAPRGPALVAGSLVAVILLWYANLAFVRPLGAVPRIKLPAVAAIPDDTNAWKRYFAALELLARHDPTFTDLAGPNRLLAYGTGQTDELEAADRALVNESGGALERLRAGAERPSAQYAARPVSATTPPPDFLAVSRLAGIALAEARDRAEASDFARADAALLSAVRFSADVSEPRGNLLAAVAAAHLQRACSRLLFAWLARGELSADRALAFARALADVERRMPTPAEVVDGERRAFVYELQGEILDGQPGRRADSQVRDVLASGAFAGLRLRSWTAFVRAFDAAHERVRPDLERWDTRTLADALRDASDTPVWRAVVDPTEFAGRSMVGLSVPQAFGPMGSLLYRARAERDALRALLVADAYRQRHGAFPESLDAACAEAGVEVPVDVKTGRPIGYRLEGGEPLVWLAGYDGADDGGRAGYEPDERLEGVPGRDLVFRRGDVPRVQLI